MCQIWSALRLVFRSTYKDDQRKRDAFRCLGFGQWEPLRLTLIQGMYLTAGSGIYILLLLLHSRLCTWTKNADGTCEHAHVLSVPLKTIHFMVNYSLPCVRCACLRAFVRMHGTHIWVSTCTPVAKKGRKTFLLWSTICHSFHVCVGVCVSE